MSIHGVETGLKAPQKNPCGVATFDNRKNVCRPWWGQYTRGSTLKYSAFAVSKKKEGLGMSSIFDKQSSFKGCVVTGRYHLNT